MKIIFSIFLTLALVSCGEIRLQTGGNDLGEVGEWEVVPSFESREWSESWLINTKTGDLYACTKRYTENGYCSPVTTPFGVEREFRDVEI